MSQETEKNKTNLVKSGQKIQFKAIDNGLGFHLFAEGMPYQPSSPDKVQAPKKTTHSESGAKLAGPIRVSPSIVSQQPISPAPFLQPTPIHETQAVEQKIESITLESTTTEVGGGYVLRRVFAYVLDLLLNLFIAAALFGFAFWKFDLSTKYLLTGQLYLFALAFLAVFSWALITAQEIAFSTTFGKHFFGLKIKGNVFLVLVRALLFIPSLGLGFLGILMGLINKERKCLHDWITGIKPTLIDDHAQSQNQ